MRDEAKWDARYSEPTFVWSAEPNRFVAEQLADRAPRGRALDLACGEGRNAVWLAQRGWDTVGVDLSAVGLAKAAELAEARGVEVAWTHADLAEYVPEESAFDVVVIAYLHTEPETQRLTFERAAASVAPGGVLVAVGHDRANLDHGYGGPQDPSVLWTVDAVVDALGGLAIEEATCVRRPVQGGEHVAIDTLVRAVRRHG